MKVASWVASALLLLTLASFAISQGQDPVAEPRAGGTLVIAAHNEPGTLDGQRVPATVTIEIAALMVEGLLAYDEVEEVQPMLASSYEVSEDGTVYRFNLRQGVTFHDGSEFGALDVVASLERWLNFGFGRDVADVIDAIVAVDPHTVEIRLSAPFPMLTKLIAVPNATAAFVYPAALVEEHGTGDIGSPVGTGPYQFAEHVPGSFVRVIRNEHYSPPSGPPNGYAGDQSAYLDEIVIRLVPDAATRAAGVETGEFHVARELPSDFYNHFVELDGVRVVTHPASPLFLNMDRSTGWTGIQEFRQAVMMSLDKEMLAASIGHPAFFSADDCNLPVPLAFQTDVCEERYHRFDPEGARQILEEIGYGGDPIRFITIPARENYFNPALMIVQMLSQVGINVDLIPVDAATLQDWRNQSERYDFFSGDHGGRSDPVLWSPLSPTHFGWFGSYPPELEEMVERMWAEPDHEIRVALWRDITDFWYDYVPMVKIADPVRMQVERTDYSGSVRSGLYTNFGIGWLQER